MHEDLEQQLYQNHPELFLRGINPIQIGCGDGWFNIIDQLCYGICEDYNNAKSSLIFAKRNTNMKLPTQISYKSYILACEEKVALQKELLPTIVSVRVKFGELVVHCMHETEKISAYINFAERMALCTCETCGNPGTIKRANWIEVRCSSCDDIIKGYGIGDFQSSRS